MKFDEAVEKAMFGSVCKSIPGHEFMEYGYIGKQFCVMYKGYVVRLLEQGEIDSIMDDEDWEPVF